MRLCENPPRPLRRPTPLAVGSSSRLTPRTPARPVAIDFGISGPLWDTVRRGTRRVDAARPDQAQKGQHQLAEGLRRLERREVTGAFDDGVARTGQRPGQRPRPLAGSRACRARPPPRAWGRSAGRGPPDAARRGPGPPSPAGPRLAERTHAAASRRPGHATPATHRAASMPSTTASTAASMSPRCSAASSASQAASQLGGRLQCRRWSRDERERRHAVGRDQRHPERHRASEGVADECCTLDRQLVHRPQDIRPRCLLAGRDPRLTEAGKVHGDGPIAGVGQGLQVLRPHRPVGDTGVEQYDGRPHALLVTGKRHSRTVPHATASGPAPFGSPRVRCSANCCSPIGNQDLCPPGRSL